MSTSSCTGALKQLHAGAGVEKVILPGNVVIDSSISPAEAEARVTPVAWHRFQMPAYHLIARRRRGHHPGQHRRRALERQDDHRPYRGACGPHCWLMVGHCGGLRQSQMIGDYVLAHAYLRRRPHPRRAGAARDPDPGACRSAGRAAGGGGARSPASAAKRSSGGLRTGTVVTNDDRNWELRCRPRAARASTMSRAIAVDMESATVAAQGYRMRVPYGTLLCVSDKPLHGEIKLPGAANAFYERAIAEHLQIGIEAIDLLRERRTTRCTPASSGASTSRRSGEQEQAPEIRSRTNDMERFWAHVCWRMGSGNVLVRWRRTASDPNGRTLPCSAGRGGSSPLSIPCSIPLASARSEP